MIRILTVIAFATCVAAPALAEANDNDEPPVREPWTNVSHINGQLVPVGERNDYLVNGAKHVNIATNPLGFFFGNYGLSLSFALGENVTFRGNIQRLDYEFFGAVDGYEVSVSAPVYLRRAFSGPFLEPGVFYRDTMETSWSLWDDDEEMPRAHVSSGPLMVAGWHWMFDSGFNIAIAFGATRDIRHTVDGENGMQIGASPTGYLRVGYAF